MMAEGGSSNSDNQERQQEDTGLMPMAVRVDMRRALIGGALAAAVTAVGAWAVGHLSGAEARALLESAVPNARTLCNTIILASATILALMLTLLSVSNSADTKLEDTHYKRIKQIALFDTVVLVSAMTICLLLNVPLIESEKVPTNWYSAIYYATLGCASLLGGMLIAIVMMLYNTIRDIIDVVGLNSEEHPFQASEDNSTSRQARSDQERETTTHGNAN